MHKIPTLLVFAAVLGITSSVKSAMPTPACPNITLDDFSNMYSQYKDFEKSHRGAKDSGKIFTYYDNKLKKDISWTFERTGNDNFDVSRLSTLHDRTFRISNPSPDASQCGYWLLRESFEEKGNEKILVRFTLIPM